MNNKLQNTQFYLFLLLIFALPLLAVDFFLTRPLLLPAAVLWIVAAVQLLLLFILIKQDPIRHTGVILVCLYFIYEITRDIVAGPGLRALFGDARGPFLSVFTSLSLLIVYIAAVQFSKNEKDRVSIIKCMAASLTVAGILGILQHFGSTTLFVTSVRAYSTLSNPIELAGVGLLALVITSGLIMTSKWKPGFIFITIISCAIVATQSKIAVFMLGLVLALFMLNALRLRMFQIAAMFFVVALAALVVNVMPVEQDLASRSAFGSTSLTNEAVADSLAGRRQIWKTAALIGFAKPVFGWGQANFPNTYTKFIKNRSDSELIVFDAHNWVIDAFAKGGIIKLALIISIIFFFIKNMRQDKLNRHLMLSIGLYMVFLLVNPSWLVSRIYLVAILGLITVNLKDRSDHSPINLPKSLAGAGIIFSVVLTFFCAYFAVTRLSAEIIGSKGVKASRSGLFDQGLYYSKSATEIFPYEPDYWSRLGWSYKISYLKSKSGNDLTEARHAYERALLITPDDIMLKKRIADLKKIEP